MADFAAVADQFVDFYYQAFDSNRSSLGSLYRDGSMLTFEREQFVGAVNIVEKLSSLPFQTVKHVVATKDAQPGATDGAIVVLVTGYLKADQDKPMGYTQTFQLMRDGGSYFVHNDVFKLTFPPPEE